MPAASQMQRLKADDPQTLNAVHLCTYVWCTYMHISILWLDICLIVPTKAAGRTVENDDLRTIYNWKPHLCAKKAHLRREIVSGELTRMFQA